MLSDLEATPKQMSRTPLSVYAMPTVSLSDPLSDPPSPLPQAASKESKGAGSQTAQYIVCCKCGKRRAVPA